MCNDKPAGHVKVKMYDSDSCELPHLHFCTHQHDFDRPNNEYFHFFIEIFNQFTVSDDLLDHGETNMDGSFSLRGTDNEVTGLDPKVNIYHDCDDGIKVSKMNGLSV